MPFTTSHTSIVAQATSKLLADFIRRLQPQMQHNSITFLQLIEAAKEMTHDEERLEVLYQDICKSQHHEDATHPQNYKEEIYRNRRLLHFRRVVIHYFMLISDEQQMVEHPISRHWLLQWYDVLEIALGKDYFIEAHQFCTDIINELQENPDFIYHDFIIHPKAMFEYAVLMTRLAIFIEIHPKKRIEWLVKAMASSPNTTSVNGVRVHNNDTPPPTFPQIKNLIIGVFNYIFQYIQENQLSDQIQERIGDTKLSPIELLKHLLVDIEVLATDR